MVGLINENKFEPGRVKFLQSITGDQTENGCHSDISISRCMLVAHLNFYRLVWVGADAMARSLLHKFPTMDEDECLRSSFSRRLHSINQLGENDLVRVNSAMCRYS